MAPRIMPGSVSFCLPKLLESAPAFQYFPWLKRAEGDNGWSDIFFCLCLCLRCFSHFILSTLNLSLKCFQSLYSFLFPPPSFYFYLFVSYLFFTPYLIYFLWCFCLSVSSFLLSVSLAPCLPLSHFLCFLPFLPILHAQTRTFRSLSHSQFSTPACRY